MKPKKNFNKDLNKKRGFYFVLGLLFILLFVYIILEWKTAHDNKGYDLGMFPNKEITQEGSTVILETNAKQPHLDSQKNKQEWQIPDTICGLELDERILSFSLVDEPPIFPSCQSEKNRRLCFNKMMQKHFIKNFNYPETTENISDYFKIRIRFIVEKDGSIIQIKIKAPSKSLEIATKSTIAKLPKMLPAKHNGIKTCISFSFPITMHFR